MADKEHWEWRDVTGPRGNYREAVALFDTEQDLQEAVDDLESHGFSNAAISRPVSPEEIESTLRRSIRSVAELEDDSRVPREPYIDRNSRSTALMVTVFAPIYILLLAGTGLATAHGMEPWQAVVLVSGLGVIGALGGGLIAYRHATRMKDRARKEKSWGGLLLWVRTGSRGQEQRALDILRRHAGRDVHLHGPAGAAAVH
ncbi:hypothetical protein [Kordiimonas marina]|uniref:hypothetical protein n=1 Tax=Kordiimonas marina TaxID=2872312 RepID=UPI001FF32ED5|nr:hypothetical protein [Kordiimonas marina]MCJ9427483.1 hypothetical protein [Kordiimonas marina]